MDFEKLTQEAKDWINQNDSKFDLFLVDSEQNRLNFEVPNKDVSFYIVVPNEEKQLTWHVWSDADTVRGRLALAIENVTGGRYNTIATILTSCEKCIFKEAASAESVSQQESGGEKKDDDDDDEEEEEDIDDYYGEGDDFAEDVQEIAKDDADIDSDEDCESFFGPMNSATGAAIQRLQKDLKNIIKVGKEYGIVAAPRGNNLFVWDVQLRDVPKDTTLGKDLQSFASKFKQEPVIDLEMQFPPEYPFSPPFIRVIKPRFKFLTGHVTIGGSICMQMLTKSGWVPSNDIESILVQVRAEILSDPNASLDTSRVNVVYTEREARDAFNRMVQRYGWNK